MATSQSLINRFNAANGPVVPATVPVTPPALGTDASMRFVTLDDITVPPGGFSGVSAFGDSLSDAGNICIATGLRSHLRLSQNGIMLTGAHDSPRASLHRNQTFVAKTFRSSQKT